MILTREQVERERAEELLRAKPRTDFLNALDTIAALNSSIESWKREEVLRDEREAGKDAEIAELKATLNLSARANNALALKIGRLVEAGDGLADLVCEQRPRLERYEDVVEAWTAAKGGPSFWVRLSGPPDDQFKTATYTIEFDDNGSTYRATGVAYKLAAEQGAKEGE